MSRSLDTLLRPSLLAVAIALCAPLASGQLIAAEQASSVRGYNLPAAPFRSATPRRSPQAPHRSPKPARHGRAWLLSVVGRAYW